MENPMCDCGHPESEHINFAWGSVCTDQSAGDCPCEELVEAAG